jgi:protein-tyrosine-phosphatase/predicted ATP-grasp superfamily ATP-dependent carboligase
MKKPERALVIGDDTRSFLATVRSLGRGGIEVHAAPYNMRAPALSSRYITKIHRLPYYLNGGADWLKALQELIFKYKYNAIIPCEERSMLPLYKHQNELSPTCKIAIPNNRSYEAFFDKIKTRDLASQLGVPVARGRKMQQAETAEALLADLTLPVVYKQRKSYSWPELYVRTSVKVVENRSQLDNLLRAAKPDYANYFFEEMFPGCGLGVSVLCHQGQILQAFEHHRAHEYEGSSYYRKSATLNADRLAAVSSMVKSVEYTGIAMFEFKLNEITDKWILLEVNARPWGSLPLPIAAGIDFPYRLYQLLVHCNKTGPKEYRSNIYARNLIADIWQMRAVSQRLSSNKIKMTLSMLRWISGFTRVLTGHEYHDAFSCIDSRPAWTEIRQLFEDRRKYSRIKNSTVPTNNAKQIIGDMIKYAKTTGGPANVVFICQGNICRSPFAELMAKKIFDMQQNIVKFTSAGMLPRNSRSSPEVAITAASRWGIDMMHHRSKCLDDSILTSAQLLILFDTINLESLDNRYPNIKCPYIFIGNFYSNKKQWLVDDPDGRKESDFVITYSNINTYLLAFHQEMTEQVGNISPNSN